MNQAITNAERAGKDYFHAHPEAGYKGAERFARKQYAVALEREVFVAGFNQAYWDEQERVLMASRS